MVPYVQSLQRKLTRYINVMPAIESNKFRHTFTNMPGSRCMMTQFQPVKASKKHWKKNSV
jgi:hypothetical protein